MFFTALVCCVAAAVSLFVAPLSFMVLSVAVAALVIFLLLTKNYKYITVLIVIVLFTVSLGCELKKVYQVKLQDGAKITGEFLLTEEITDHGIFNSFLVKPVNNNAIPKDVKIFVYDYDKSNYKMGDIVSGTLEIGSIDRYDKFYISNYSNKIYAVADIKNLQQTGRYDRFYKTAANIRSYVKDSVFHNFKGDTAALLLALTTGDKTCLSDSFLANVKTTGISHVIVVSGLHLSIIMLAVFWCLDRLFYNKYIRCIFAVLVVFSICAVCGFTMSIIRAGVMFIIASLAPVFSRDNDSLNSLLTAVALVLVSAPFAIFNISFQLSVLSTLAIVWVMPFYSALIKQKLALKSKFLKFIIDTVLCSFFAIIFTLPVTVKIFGFVSIVAPVTNLIISYPVMIALIFNIIALIISAVPLLNFVSILFYWVAGMSSRFMVFSVNNIAKLPITVAVLPKVAFWWSMAIIALIIGFMYIYNFKKKRSDLNANSI